MHLKPAAQTGVPQLVGKVAPPPAPPPGPHGGHDAFGAPPSPMASPRNGGGGRSVVATTKAAARTPSPPPDLQIGVLARVYAPGEADPQELAAMLRQHWPVLARSTSSASAAVLAAGTAAAAAASAAGVSFAEGAAGDGGGGAAALPSRAFRGSVYRASAATIKHRGRGMVRSLTQMMWDDSKDALRELTSGQGGGLAADDSEVFGVAATATTTATATRASASESDEEGQHLPESDSQARRTPLPFVGAAEGEAQPPSGDAGMEPQPSMLDLVVAAATGSSDAAAGPAPVVEQAQQPAGISTDGGFGSIPAPDAEQQPAARDGSPSGSAPPAGAERPLNARRPAPVDTAAAAVASAQAAQPGVVVLAAAVEPERAAAAAAHPGAATVDATTPKRPTFALPDAAPPAATASHHSLTIPHPEHSPDPATLAAAAAAGSRPMSAAAWTPTSVARARASPMSPPAGPPPEHLGFDDDMQLAAVIPAYILQAIDEDEKELKRQALLAAAAAASPASRSSASPLADGDEPGAGAPGSPAAAARAVRRQQSSAAASARGGSVSGAAAPRQRGAAAAPSARQSMRVRAAAVAAAAARASVAAEGSAASLAASGVGPWSGVPAGAGSEAAHGSGEEEDGSGDIDLHKREVREGLQRWGKLRTIARTSSSVRRQSCCSIVGCAASTGAQVWVRDMVHDPSGITNPLVAGLMTQALAAVPSLGQALAGTAAGAGINPASRDASLMHMAATSAAMTGAVPVPMPTDSPADAALGEAGAATAAPLASPRGAAAAAAAADVALLRVRLPAPAGGLPEPQMRDVPGSESDDAARRMLAAAQARRAQQAAAAAALAAVAAGGGGAGAGGPGGAAGWHVAAPGGSPAGGVGRAGGGRLGGRLAGPSFTSQQQQQQGAPTVGNVLAEALPAAAGVPTVAALASGGSQASGAALAAARQQLLAEAAAPEAQATATSLRMQSMAPFSSSLLLRNRLRMRAAQLGQAQPAAALQGSPTGAGSAPGYLPAPGATASHGLGLAGVDGEDGALQEGQLGRVPLVVEVEGASLLQRDLAYVTLEMPPPIKTTPDVELHGTLRAPPPAPPPTLPPPPPQGAHMKAAMANVILSEGGPRGEQKPRYVPTFMRSKREPVQPANQKMAVVQQQWVVPAFSSTTGFQAGLYDEDAEVMIFD